MPKSTFSNLNTIALLFFSFVSALGVCACNSNSKELSRLTAESLIKNSAEFKYPAVFHLRRANENEPLFREMLSNSETLEESKAQDLNGYWQSDAHLAVLNQLGLISVEQNFIKEDPGMGQHIKPSRYFITKFRANDKGKALWKETGLDATDESIPLAIKKFSGTSGITQQGESQAIAEFSYELVPNSLGKTFDLGTEEFKSLPVELQKQIRGETGTPSKDGRANWSGARKGKGLFQKYDDG